MIPYRGLGYAGMVVNDLGACWVITWSGADEGAEDLASLWNTVGVSLDLHFDSLS